MTILTWRDVPIPWVLRNTYEDFSILYNHLRSTTDKNMAALSRYDQELWSQLVDSGQSVVDAFRQFEGSVIAPAAEFVEIAFRKHPIISTFASVFLVLVSLPFLSFLGLVVFVVTSTTFTSLCAAFVTSALVIGLSGAFLAVLVLLLAALSMWVSTAILFGYIVWRLYVLVRADGRAGVSQWSAETKTRFRRQKRGAEERRGRSPEPAMPAKEEDTKPLPDQLTSETVKP